MKQENIKRGSLVTMGLMVLIFLSGCKDDPLTELIKENGYAPIVPIPEMQHIGDIYRTMDLSKPPVVLMREIFPKEENDSLMNSMKGAVYLPVQSGEETFALTGEADVIGYAQAGLSAHKAKKFKVKVGGACQYIVSEYKFEQDLYPKIKNKVPNKNLSGTFVVLALLQATSIEYELIDENGAKISVEPGGDIEKIVKANLGAEWKANENHNLSVATPCYIGYRMFTLTESGFKIALIDKPDANRVTPMDVNRPRTTPVVLKKVPAKTLRKSLAIRNK